MRPAPVIVALVLTAAFAGCLADEKTTTVANSASSTSSVPPAPEPTTTVDLGSIRGVVVTDESVPISGAKVGLVETGAAATTDAAGSFTFNDLPPATYTLAVEMIGYEPGGKKAEVQAGEVANVTIQLTSIELPEAGYAVGIKRTAMFHYSFRLANFAVSIVNHSSVNQLACDPCLFVLHFPLKPKQALTETHWTSTSPVPMTNQDTYLYYKSAWTTGAYADGTSAHANQYENREAVKWGTTPIATTGKVLLHASASYFGSIEHKVDIYTSFAYGEDFPDTYTMLPPP